MEVHIHFQQNKRKHPREVTSET